MAELESRKKKNLVSARSFYISEKRTVYGTGFSKRIEEWKLPLFCPLSTFSESVAAKKWIHCVSREKLIHLSCANYPSICLSGSY